MAEHPWELGRGQAGKENGGPRQVWPPPPHLWAPVPAELSSPCKQGCARPAPRAALGQAGWRGCPSPHTTGSRGAEPTRPAGSGHTSPRGAHSSPLLGSLGVTTPPEGHEGPSGYYYPHPKPHLACKELQVTLEPCRLRGADPMQLEAASNF